MTGKLMARCGSCEAINDVTSLSVVTECAACKRDISIIENYSERLPTGVLLGYVNVSVVRVPRY